MSSHDKSSMALFMVASFMALFLWYRNEEYDRYLSGFVFLVGLMELIEYGIYNGANSQQAAKMVYVDLWAQCLALSLGIYFFIQQNQTNSSTTENVISAIAFYNAIVFSIVFLVSVVYIITTDDIFKSVPTSDQRVQYFTNDKSMLESLQWFYILGIFLPLVLLFGFYFWSNFGVALLILYLGLTACYVLSHYSIESFNSVWSYLMVGFIFILWLANLKI